jgi:hypothetical protein
VLKTCFSLAILILAPVLAFADPVQHDPISYQPEVLPSVIQRAQETVANGQRPVVVFDLDDTLFDSRTRTKLIFHEFAEDTSMQTQFPNETRVLDQVRIEDIQYSLKDTLVDFGIDTPDFETALNTYWVARFFTSAYCVVDRPIAGAANYVRELEAAGAFIIYLTGRDTPNMGAGTTTALLSNHFPTDPEGTYLLMKSDHAIDDLTFKQQAFSWIKQQGTVIAGFENEPRNINAYDAAFAGGTMVLLDTIRSNAPDVPNTDVYWVGNFEY